MTFTTHTTESAPSASRATLAAIEQRYGFIPNLAGVFAESPAAFNGMLGLIQAFEDEAITLAPLERQVVLLAAAAENRCDYCAAAHGMLAHSLGLTREQVQRLQGQQELEDPTLEALRVFTTEIVRNRGFSQGDRLAAFLNAGFSRAQVFEVLLGIALKTLTNYANHLSRPEVNAQFKQFLPDWEQAA